MNTLEVGKPKLYIMCGLAFSGKTTLASKIASHTNSVLISFDTLWAESEKKNLIREPNDGWKYIRKLAQGQIIKTLSSGRSAVYDDTNVRFEHREEIRVVVSKIGIKTVLVYLETPIKIILQREAENKITRGRHEVDSINFKNAIDQFQAPTDGESFISFRPGDNIDNWLQYLEN